MVEVGVVVVVGVDVAVDVTVLVVSSLMIGDTSSPSTVANVKMSSSPSSSCTRACSSFAASVDLSACARARRGRESVCVRESESMYKYVRCMACIEI